MVLFVPTSMHMESKTGLSQPVSQPSCTVLSGNRIALLLPPAQCPAYARQGISKPLMVGKRHDTDGRWRQVTKLPRPCPQYPPFTLGNGIFWFSRQRIMAVPASPQCRLQTLRVTARAFDVILLTGSYGNGHAVPCASRRQSPRPCLGCLLSVQPRPTGETRILIL